MQSPVSLGGARQPDASNHLCLRFERRAEFEERAREYLRAGLAAGERVLYVAPGDPAELADRLRLPEPGVDVRPDAVQVASLSATYRFDTVIDPRQQVLAYAEATEAALAAGFTGLRVAADATALARTPAQLDAFARYEHLVDRYMTDHPMSAMCAYDRTELGDEAVAQIACLHPVTSVDATPFHLHTHARGAAAALDGELDDRVRELWPAALGRAELRSTGGEVVIDATGLEFIDHRNLLALADYADRRGTTVVLRTALSHPAHLLRVLNVTTVRVEQAA
ncbi:MEDS domain-containing protein [Actinosynnema sp. NPDC053489]|uniref:MEDS domain-containing protein n=1 Tax=Actinosynnema sp. NPDC053489 TaxID=3363916 RepID=UPI0037CA3F97